MPVAGRSNLHQQHPQSRDSSPSREHLLMGHESSEEVSTYKVYDKQPQSALTAIKSKAQTLGKAKSAFKKCTWQLFVGAATAALVCVLFGFDVGSFAGVQQIPSFENEFGTPIGKHGSYKLSASRVSFISSVAFAGKLIGTIWAPFVIERLGHKIGFWTLCIVSYVGIILECTAHTVAQFVVGRIVVYTAVGLAEVIAPTYQSEIVPAGQRGAVVSSVQLSISAGQIIAAGVNRVWSKETSENGWIYPVALQAIFPVVVFFAVFLIVDTPRWLLSRNRKEDAVKSLEKLRPKEDVAAGLCQQEADAIEEALNNKMEKGPWLDLLRGTNLRRTMIAIVLFTLQQFIGQSFVSSYAPRFYTEQGLGEYAFDYQIGSASLGFLGCLFSLLISDTVGRRPILIYGALLQALWMFLISGLGTIKNPSTSVQNGLVASVMLYQMSYVGTWGPMAYVVAAEVGTGPLREKTMSVGAAFNVVSAWVVVFSIPYILAAIGPNIGWVFGSIAIFSALYTYIFVPELKGRSLEEVDELFAKNIPARKFATTQVTGAGARVSQMENHPAGAEGARRASKASAGQSSEHEL